MTLDEFIAECKSMGIPGNFQLCVEAMGGMRGGKDINRVSLGFDWDANSVILHPVLPLQVIPEAREPKRGGINPPAPVGRRPSPPPAPPLPPRVRHSIRIEGF